MSAELPPALRLANLSRLPLAYKRVALRIVQPNLFGSAEVVDDLTQLQQLLPGMPSNSRSLLIPSTYHLLTNEVSALERAMDTRDSLTLADQLIALTSAIQLSSQIMTQSDLPIAAKEHVWRCIWYWAPILDWLAEQMPDLLARDQLYWTLVATFTQYAQFTSQTTVLKTPGVRTILFRGWIHLLTSGSGWFPPIFLGGLRVLTQDIHDEDGMCLEELHAAVGNWDCVADAFVKTLALLFPKPDAPCGEFSDNIVEFMGWLWDAGMKDSILRRRPRKFAFHLTTCCRALAASFDFSRTSLTKALRLLMECVNSGGAASIRVISVPDHQR